jgi:hypothetical protein
MLCVVAVQQFEQVVWHRLTGDPAIAVPQRALDPQLEGPRLLRAANPPVMLGARPHAEAKLQLTGSCGRL